MNRTIFVLLSIIALFNGCTRDDICDESNATTPLLVINFKDVNDRISSKQVTNLRVLINTVDSTEVVAAISDTILSIPLNTEQDFSDFIFIQNSTSEDDINADNIQFVYDTEEAYVNRACAFRVTYNNLLIDVENETITQNWILDTEILTNIIENDNEAHITIFH